MISALKNAKVTPPTEIHPYLAAGTVDWELGDSFNLRLLIHYVGDIH